MRIGQNEWAHANDQLALVAFESSRRGLRRLYEHYLHGWRRLWPYAGWRRCSRSLNGRRVGQRHGHRGWHGRDRRRRGCAGHGGISWLHDGSRFGR